MYQDNDTIRTILATTRTIDVVGLSADPSKPSHYVSAYMQAAGYRIIPVNPTVNGDLLGEKVYADLASIPEQPVRSGQVVIHGTLGEVLQKARELTAKKNQ